MQSRRASQAFPSTSSLNPDESSGSEENARVSFHFEVDTFRWQHRGYLVKRGAKRKTWKRRWFVLSNNILMYFRNENARSPIRCIYMEDSVVCSVEDEKALSGCPTPYVVAVTTPNRTFWLCAESDSELMRWTKALVECRFSFWKRRSNDLEASVVDMKTTNEALISEVRDYEAKYKASEEVAMKLTNEMLEIKRKYIAVSTELARNQEAFYEKDKTIALLRASNEELSERAQKAQQAPSPKFKRSSKFFSHSPPTVSPPPEPDDGEGLYTNKTKLPTPPQLSGFLCARWRRDPDNESECSSVESVATGYMASELADRNEFVNAMSDLYPSFRGRLLKLSDNVLVWRERYFVLADNVLHYFVNDEAEKVRGSLPLDEACILTGDDVKAPRQREYCFTLVCPRSAPRMGMDTDSPAAPESDTQDSARFLRFYLAADNAEDYMAWVNKLRESCLIHTKVELEQERREHRSKEEQLQMRGSEMDMMRKELRRLDWQLQTLMNQASERRKSIMSLDGSATPDAASPVSVSPEGGRLRIVDRSVSLSPRDRLAPPRRASLSPLGLQSGPL
eukprot:Rmarinus@m.6255